VARERTRTLDIEFPAIPLSHEGPCTSQPGKRIDPDRS
jgi:hypothetical protein